MSDISIHCGDFIQLSDLVAGVDLVICDLPYGMTKNEWDVAVDLDSMWKFYRKVCKPNAMILLTAIQPYAAELIMSNRSGFRYEWIWEKSQPTGHLNAKRMPMRAHEHVLVFCNGKPSYRPIKTNGHARKVATEKHRAKCKKTTNYCEFGLHSYDSTERFPRSVIKFPTDKQKSSIHPTQKPVALIEYLVRTYSDPGSLVLDNCMGSGTTGVACRNLSRRFIGIELNESIFRSAKERLSL